MYPVAVATNAFSGDSWMLGGLGFVSDATAGGG